MTETTERPKLVQLTDEEIGPFGLFLKHAIGDHSACRDCLILGSEAYDDYKKTLKAHDALMAALRAVEKASDKCLLCGKYSHAANCQLADALTKGDATA